MDIVSAVTANAAAVSPSETPEVHSDEVYCMDYISDMKVSDATQLTHQGGLLYIEDTWRAEWEKPIQVTRRATLERFLEVEESCGGAEDILGKEIDFGGLAARGLIKQDQLQQLSTLGTDTGNWVHQQQSAALAEDFQTEIIMPKYNCDEQDTIWLGNMNKELFPYLDGSDGTFGPLFSPELLEFVFDFLQETVHGRLQVLINSQKGGGIEFDENTFCDVCREGTCEEGNEIVFCDKCDLGVHQGCYGIFNIPEGDWLCKTCYLGIKPRCFLCPHRGGAMKNTINGKRWCHVSCVLWVNETSFGDLYKMEPVIHLKSIPDSRWALVCVLCRQKVGACIQCSFKTCAIAYHVTCGFDANLEITTDQHPITGDLRFKSYCPKHTTERRRKKKQEGSNDTSTLKYQKLNAMKNKNLSTSPNDGNAAKLVHTDESALFKNHVLNSLCKFHTLVTAEELAQKMNLKPIQASLLFEYWKMKRMSTSLFHSQAFVSSEAPGEDNAALGLLDVRLTPEQQEQADVVESLRNRTTMFVSLRQDFEKVRNMMTLIQKRERALKTYHRVSYEMFKRQLLLAGFDLLSEFLCPSSDLVAVKHKDIGDNNTSSADEGIESGGHSDIEIVPLSIPTTLTTLKRKPCQDEEFCDQVLPKRIKLKPKRFLTDNVVVNNDLQIIKTSSDQQAKPKKSVSLMEIGSFSNAISNGLDRGEKKVKEKRTSKSVNGFSSHSTHDRENVKKLHKHFEASFQKIEVTKTCFPSLQNIVQGKTEIKKESPLPKLSETQLLHPTLNGFSVSALHSDVTRDSTDSKPSDTWSGLGPGFNEFNSSGKEDTKEKAEEKVVEKTEDKLSFNTISPNAKTKSENPKKSFKPRTPSKISPGGDLIFDRVIDDKAKPPTLSNTSNIFASLESKSLLHISTPAQCLNWSSNSYSKSTTPSSKMPSNGHDHVHPQDCSTAMNSSPDWKAISPSQAKPQNGHKLTLPSFSNAGGDKSATKVTSKCADKKKKSDKISSRPPKEMSFDEICAITVPKPSGPKLSKSSKHGNQNNHHSPQSLFEKIASADFLEAQTSPLCSPTSPDVSGLKN